jgi:catechol 2,3-dioxygenase-like lactoylglutathione lyase family enzyme
LEAKTIIKASGEQYFAVMDPEGHRIGFMPSSPSSTPPSSDGMHIIHAGFVVHDRDAEDKFYKDILGFHVYWHGGMKDGEDNWVDMQVPDGTDWIEYMLRVSPDASHKTLGVMNHIALGVPDIQAAKEQLIKNGWKGTEEPKIGRDGKWQLNLYDPDETRVELMEFKPTKEPCCSAYTGPHPHP